MGIFDNIGKGVLDAVKTAATAATSYVEQLEQQAAEREKEKQQQAEAESQALQKLEEEKNKILQEIQAEKEKIAEERRKLEESRQDLSYVDPKPTQTEPTQQPPEPKQVKEEPSGDLYVGTADDPKSLLDQLADMNAQQNELARRCIEMGLGDEVQGIVGIPDTTEEKESFNLEDISTIPIVTENMTRQVRDALTLMMQAMQASKEQQEELLKEALRAIKGAEQAAKDVEDLANDIERKAREIEEKAEASVLSAISGTPYDWNRKPMYISFGDPLDVYAKLDSIWNKISFGSKRDPVTGDPIEFPKFTPHAMASGSAISQSYEVPEYALNTPTSFENWCKTVGFGNGVSLEIINMIEKPGFKNVL